MLQETRTQLNHIQQTTKVLVEVAQFHTQLQTAMLKLVQLVHHQVLQTQFQVLQVLQTTYTLLDNVHTMYTTKLAVKSVLLGVMLTTGLAQQQLQVTQ